MSRPLPVEVKLREFSDRDVSGLLPEFGGLAAQMKRPKPEFPTNAPAGTVWFGGPIEWFEITLRIEGEDLNPDEVTALMQCEPDKAGQKGKVSHWKDPSVGKTSKRGFWWMVLKSASTDEWDCGEAKLELLDKLPENAEIWRRLACRFRIDVFVGLRMRATNKGFELSPKVLSYLGERGISASFDIYYEADDHKSTSPVSDQR